MTMNSVEQQFEHETNYSDEQINKKQTKNKKKTIESNNENCGANKIKETAKQPKSLHLNKLNNCTPSFQTSFKLIC